MRLEKKVKKEVLANRLSSALLSEKSLAKEWLSKKEGAPSYTLIFAGHIAHIARDTGGRMTGVLLENEAMYQSHKMIFEELWNRL